MDGARDLYRKGEQLTHKKEIIRNSKEISPLNKKIIFSFLKWGKVHGNRGMGLSDARLFKYAVMLYNLVRWLARDFPEADMKDMERLVSKVRSNGFTESTIVSYNVAIRCFFRWLYGSEYIPKKLRTEGDIYPKIVRWIPTSDRKCRKRTSAEILSEAEILRMVEAAYTPRDKALIYTLYQSGCRIGEMLNLKLKDVHPDEQGRGIWIDIKVSKTEPRSILLIESAPHLGAWMNVHPRPQGDDSYLWINVKNKPMSVANVHKVLKMLRDRTGQTKKVFPHIMRHSILTEKGKYMPAPLLRKFSGHSTNSKAIFDYCHPTDETVAEEECRRRGITPQKKVKENPIKICPNCGSICGAKDKFCLKCAMPLNSKELARLARAKDGEMEEIRKKVATLFDALHKKGILDEVLDELET